MTHVKLECTYCPPPPHSRRQPHDWEMHPSWINGMEALNAYGDWVSSVVLPVAFQWIEEHKAEVYASVPDNLRDDVGTVMAAAFKLVKQLPAYQRGTEKDSEYEAAVKAGTWDPSKTNPRWTGIVQKVRACTKAAHEQPASPADTKK